MISEAAARRARRKKQHERQQEELQDEAAESKAGMKGTESEHQSQQTREIFSQLQAKNDELVKQMENMSAEMKKLREENDELRRRMDEVEDRDKRIEMMEKRIEKMEEKGSQINQEAERRSQQEPELEKTPERIIGARKWADIDSDSDTKGGGADIVNSDSKEVDSLDEQKDAAEEFDDGADFEQFESKSQKKKKKKKKDEEEEVKKVSDDDRFKEMMGEDAYNQVKEMFATFRSDILSHYKESLRSNLETIRQEVRSR